MDLNLNGACIFKVWSRCFVYEKIRIKNYRRQARRKVFLLIVAPFLFHIFFVSILLSFYFLFFLLYMHTYMHTHTYVKMYPYKQTYFYMHFNFMWIYTLLLICLLSYNSDIKKKLRLGIPNLHRRYQVVTNGIYSWKWFLGIRPLKCNKKIYMFSLIKNHGFSNCPS